MRTVLISLFALSLWTIPLHAQAPPACNLENSINVCTFEGIDASQIQGVGYNVDPNGAIGTSQYLEWTDPVYQGYSKIYPYRAVWPSGPVDGSTPWRYHGLPDCVGPSGNVVVNFDKLAKRWVIGRRQALAGQPYYYCIAVSSTDQLSTNMTWYPYGFDLTQILGKNAEGDTYYPDYPRISTWGDAYYVTIDVEDPDQGYPEVGVIACAFDRADMLKGGTMLAPICFKNPSTFNQLFYAHSLLPADADGTLAPPKGMVEVFASLENPVTGNTSNSLNLWEFHVNWSNPSLSTFTGPKSITVPTYTQGCYTPDLPTNTVCVPEPSTSGTNNFIDSVGDRLMQRLSFRSTGGAHPTYLYTFANTVQVGTGVESQTGVSWYVFNQAGVRHSGIINPGDSNYRFMPSAAMDKAGNVAVGYSASGYSLHPAIDASYFNFQNGTPTEINLFSGTADEENTFHWGVYTSMTVDPADDCTFWYVNEYFDTTQFTNPTWQTRIANFKLPTCN
jgi:hypothetical protein